MEPLPSKSLIITVVIIIVVVVVWCLWVFFTTFRAKRRVLVSVKEPHTEVGECQLVENVQAVSLES